MDEGCISLAVCFADSESRAGGAGGSGICVYSAWLICARQLKDYSTCLERTPRLFTKLVARFLCGVGEHGEVGTIV